MSAWLRINPNCFEPLGIIVDDQRLDQTIQVAVELQMLPIKHGLHIPSDVYLATMMATAPVDPEVFNKPMRARIDRIALFSDELLRLAAILQAARSA